MSLFLSVQSTGSGTSVTAWGHVTAIYSKNVCKSDMCHPQAFPPSLLCDLHLFFTPHLPDGGRRSDGDCEASDMQGHKKKNHLME